MKSFRALARQLDRRRGALPRGPLGRLAAAAAAPATAVRAARRFVRRNGASVRAASGVPRWRQAAQLIWLRLRYDLRANAYVDFQLYRPERWRVAGRFVGSAQHNAFTKFIATHLRQTTDLQRAWDKRTFPEWCAERGLPATPILLEWDDGAVVFDALPGGALPAADLFSKPANLYQGVGAARWVYDGRGGYVGRDGRARSGSELLAELAESSRKLPAVEGRTTRRLILMPCLHNHPALAPVTNASLCTARIVTYCQPGGPPELLVAAYKMAVGSAAADNFHFGGIVAPIDPATGRLGPALRKRRGVLVPMDRHPDTGAPIEGHALPYWPEAVAVCLRAHAAVPNAPTMAFDVALTADGPVLVEVNVSSGPDIMQAPNGRPLAETRYVEALNAHARAILAARPAGAA